MPCAHIDGHCYDQPEKSDGMVGRMRASLLKENRWAVGFAIAPIMRSGVISLVWNKLGLNHLTSVPQRIRIDFGALQTWDDVRRASYFECKFQAYLVSFIKLVFFHVMQPLLFFVPFISYCSGMGRIQLGCATAVVVNELLYCFWIVKGLTKNAKWLLYAPQGDTRPEQFEGVHSTPMWYFVNPAAFIAYSIKEPGDTGNGLRFALVCGIIASVSSFVALVVGFAPTLPGYEFRGVMFPTLCVGYVLAFIEGPIMLLICCLPERVCCYPDNAKVRVLYLACFPKCGERQ